MHELFAHFLQGLPITSLLRYGEPIYLIFFTLPMACITSFVVLQLALRSVGIKKTVRESLVPGIILGVVIFITREIFPVPFHIIPSLLAMAFLLKAISPIDNKTAAIAVVFTETIVIIGSILLVEPALLFFVKEQHITLAISTYIGLSLGTLGETIVPALVLLLFIHYDFSLLRR